MGREQQKLRILRNAAFRKQGGLCCWCGKPMIRGSHNDPWGVSAEHLVPQSKGGKTKPGNVLAAHRKCNNERHGPEQREMAKAPSTYTCGDYSVRSPFEVLV